MTLVVAKTVAEVRQHVAAARAGRAKIGLVPTMGALHEGHISLLDAAAAETTHVVASIFVNPAQFGPHEDLERYPRPLEQDLLVCGLHGVQLVFVPTVQEMYPPKYRTYVEVHGLQDVLEGASRPGHFRGVATVVLKLLNIVQPDVAYFGQKDAQQARIIGQMVHDLNVPVELRVCPIVRAQDGLALSSRNQYLGAEQRQQAAALHRALQEAAHLIRAGEHNAAQIRQVLQERIDAAPAATLDYAAVVDAESLQPLERLGGTVLIALAVRFGSTRLIDNIMIDVGRE